MTKTTLIEALAYDCGLTKKESRTIVDTLFKLMSDSLIAGEDVTITDFASLRIKDRPAKRYRNSTTNEIKVLPAGKRIKVKMSESLLRRIDPED